MSVFPLSCSVCLSATQIYLFFFSLYLLYPNPPYSTTLSPYFHLSLSLSLSLSLYYIDICITLLQLDVIVSCIDQILPLVKKLYSYICSVSMIFSVHSLSYITTYSLNFTTAKKEHSKNKKIMIGGKQNLSEVVTLCHSTAKFKKIIMKINTFPQPRHSSGCRYTP